MIRCLPSLLALGAWLWCPTMAALGQDEPPVCQLRFLAVGNSPPFDQFIDRDGVRVEKPPPPGSLPPRKLRLERRKAGDEREELGDVVLSLGRVSPPIEVPIAGEQPLQLREEDGESPWLELRAPSVPGRYLLVLRREAIGASWDKVQMRVVKDDLPPGGVHFVNASSRTLALVFGSKRIALASGKDWTTRLVPGKVVGFQLGAPDDEGRLRRAVSRSLEQGDGERTLVVVSEPDRLDARDKLKLTVLRERVKKRLPPEEEAN